MGGKVFGRLLVLRRIGSRNNKAVWECLCSCGNKVEVLGKSLRLGITQSCGCLRNERVVEVCSKHGMCKSPEYMAYCGAKGRCENAKDERYSDYGGRGIKFLFASFEHFFSELGLRPKGKSLDRIDNNGNYEPGNVRWATLELQNNNRRKRVKYSRYADGTFKETQ